MPVATQQHAEIIEPRDDALQFHAIHQENGEWDFVFADVIEKSVLRVLCAVGCHGRCPVHLCREPLPHGIFLAFYKRFSLWLSFLQNRPNLWPTRLLEGAAGDDASPSSRRLLALSGLGVTVVGAPKRDCHGAGLAVPDYPAIDPYNWQHNLACRRNKSLARPVGLLQRKRSLFDGQAIRLYGIEQNGTGDPSQNRVVRVSGNQCPG